jgi:hypothetical protein
MLRDGLRSRGRRVSAESALMVAGGSGPGELADR